ncbi:hypothetical protein RUM44_012581 [Polyplax serrata]|uniref:Uncharacterized protein n=1 Tax=Polyplax serrata TaxID=468196 RepID=A0ABR1BGL5_POLSC
MEHDEDDEAKEKGRENFEVKAERIVCCGTTTSTAASISPLSLPFDSGRRKSSETAACSAEEYLTVSRFEFHQNPTEKRSGSSFSSSQENRFVLAYFFLFNPSDGRRVNFVINGPPDLPDATPPPSPCALPATSLKCLTLN